MTIGLCVFFRINVFFFWNILCSGITGSYGSSIFNFWEISIQFFIVVATVYLPTNNYHFSTFSLTFFICRLFDNSHSDRWDDTHRGFDLHFPDDYWCWASFHVSIGLLYISFAEICFQTFCYFWVFFFLRCCVSYLYILLVN